MTAARHWLSDHSIILVNASSLVGTRLITSGLGFVYWWLAARLFTQENVGLASAAVSAMQLLGTIGVIGMGTLLIGELPRRGDDQTSLISTALVASGLAATLLGLAFAFATPLLSDQLVSLMGSGWRMTLFVAGVTLTTVTLVLDQALIGLLRGQAQLWRNVVFAVLKLATLFLIGRFARRDDGMLIYATWALGNIVSLGYVYASVFARSRPAKPARAAQPRWHLLAALRGQALKHYVLNLTLQIPGYALPVLVTLLLSATMTASFYAAWMVASFLFAIPHALTTALYAVGAADLSRLAEKARFTLRLAVGIGAAGALALLAGAHVLLSLFGPDYADQASATLRIFALAVIPMTVKVHFVAICQVRGRLLHAAQLMAVGGILELLLAVLGAHLDGQAGLALGWVVAITFEAAATLPLVYRTAFAGRSRSLAGLEGAVRGS